MRTLLCVCDKQKRDAVNSSPHLCFLFSHVHIGIAPTNKVEQFVLSLMTYKKEGTESKEERYTW